jgi:BMFP domain-containing protein YqiC
MPTAAEMNAWLAGIEAAALERIVALEARVAELEAESRDRAYEAETEAIEREWH